LHRKHIVLSEKLLKRSWHIMNKEVYQIIGSTELFSSRVQMRSRQTAVSMWILASQGVRCKARWYESFAPFAADKHVLLHSRTEALNVCSSMPHLISPCSHGKHLASASWHKVWDIHGWIEYVIRWQANLND
jgi:hypothetical protein